MVLWFILTLPLIAAALALWASRHRTVPGGVTVLATALQLLLALAVAARCASGAMVTALPGWVSCDAFGALVLALCAFAGFTAALFSIGFTRRATQPMEAGRVRRYFVRFNLFLVPVLAVPLLSNVALVWIAVALTTLLSIFLVSFDQSTAALEAAWKYAILTSMGAALALFGVLVLYWAMRQGGAEDFTWSGLAAAAGAMPPLLVKTAFLFMLVGYGTKAALVPFHSWLPDVYSQAPVPICALLSVVETTTLPYVIVRLLPLFPGKAGDGAGRWLLAFGLLSAVGAALLLVQVKDLKRLFAYSTIENAGIILTAAGLGGAAGYGSVYQLMNHALAKPFGFFAAGAALLFAGTTEIAAVQGLGRRSPLAGAALLAGALAVTGAPPLRPLPERAVHPPGRRRGPPLSPRGPAHALHGGRLLRGPLPRDPHGVRQGLRHGAPAGLPQELRPGAFRGLRAGGAAGRESARLGRTPTAPGRDGAGEVMP